MPFRPQVQKLGIDLGVNDEVTVEDDAAAGANMKRVTIDGKSKTFTADEVAQPGFFARFKAELAGVA